MVNGPTDRTIYIFRERERERDRERDRDESFRKYSCEYTLERSCSMNKAVS